MNCRPERKLQELAQSLGVQTSYTDTSGHPQQAPIGTLLAVLRALGHPIHDLSDVPDAWHDARRGVWRRALEPVIVAWERKAVAVRLRVPAEKGNRKIKVTLTLEEGHRQRWQFVPNQGKILQTAKVDGSAFLLQSLRLPAMPLGYHQLDLETAWGAFQALVLASPVHCYSEPRSPAKSWGLFLPMYAAHSDRSWGGGNLTDWQGFGQWTSSLGGQFTASLPLLASFLSGPMFEPSPYSPASRLFWNEFYLDVEKVPELAGCKPAQELVKSASFQRQLAVFRHDPHVGYAQQMGARRQVLELLARHIYGCSSPRRRQFERFLRENPRVLDYARFMATCERKRCSWHSWEDRLRNGRLQSGDFDEENARYHACVQWLAASQMQAVTDCGHSLGLKLYLDLPVGVNPDSFDVWRYRQAFAVGANAGAPPDRFFSKGQDWGFAPFHPQRNREEHYAYILDLLRFHMRHAKILRLDHVMGLHRLYWIPRGVPPSQGAYVQYPADELFALLTLESHRHGTILVGEDLGTVPPEIVRRMKRHGLRRLFVLQFQQRPDPNAALSLPPQCSVASLNTHDMPTFAAHWKGKDITDRARLGLIPSGQVRTEREQRRKLNAALATFLQRKGLLKDAQDCDTRTILRACIDWLGKSPAEMVMINLEDLWLEELPQNVPGTSKERPNWRQKARLSLDAIYQSPRLRELLLELSSCRKGARRTRRPGSEPR